MQEIWYQSANKIKKRWLHWKKDPSNLQDLICCQCFKLKSNWPTLLINTIFNYSPIKQEQRLWVKSNGVGLTMFTSSTPTLDLTDFIQKSHVLKDRNLDIR